MQRRRRTAQQLIVAAALGAVLGALPSSVGSAATVSDSASATVTLDAPGTLPLDQFNPALGTLTSVQVSITTSALVQVCIENTSAQSEAIAGGTASGTLDAAFPGAAARAVATAEATGAQTTLAASNGTANCTAGFDATAGRFPGPVSAGDVTFFQQSNQGTNTATLTTSVQLAPYTGTGTVNVSYTAQNDTDLVLPAEWQNTAVAQGHLQASVTYTYTVAGGEIPRTGGSSYPLVTIAMIVVAVGIGTVLFARHWRTRRALEGGEAR